MKNLGLFVMILKKIVMAAANSLFFILCFLLNFIPLQPKSGHHVRLPAIS